MMRNRHCCFTLVEVVVAMTILAFVGTIIAGSLAGFQRSYGRVAKLSKSLERNRSLDRMAELLRNVIPFFWPDEDDDDTERLVFAGAPDELWFTSRRLPGADGEGALIFVRLYVDDEKRLVADYRTRPLLPWIELKDQTGFRNAVIAENVERLTLLYGDWNDDDEMDWLEEWDQDDDDYENRLPPAIQFTVEFTDGEKVSYLRRTAGVSAFSGVSQ